MLKRMHEFLREWSLTEGRGALTIVPTLWKSNLLTKEEQDFAHDVLYDEEMKHSAWARKAAGCLGPSNFVIEADPLPEHTDLAILMRVGFAEQIFLRKTKDIRQVLSRFLPEGVIDGFDHLCIEERGHVLWNRRVLNRLRPLVSFDEWRRAHVEAVHLYSADILRPKLAGLFESISLAVKKDNASHISEGRTT